MPIDKTENIMESTMVIKYSTIDVLYSFKYVKTLEYLFISNK